MRKIRVVIPKGSIYEHVLRLFQDAGTGLQVNKRVYRPVVNDEEIEIKIMRPQNIPKLIELGSHDAGFSGYEQKGVRSGHWTNRMYYRGKARTIKRVGCNLGKNVQCPDLTPLVNIGAS